MMSGRDAVDPVAIDQRVRDGDGLVVVADEPESDVAQHHELAAGTCQRASGIEAR